MLPPGSALILDQYAKKGKWGANSLAQPRGEILMGLVIPRMAKNLGKMPASAQFSLTSE